MEATVDPQPRGPDWMPITPKTGSLFHADSHPRHEIGRTARWAVVFSRMRWSRRNCGSLCRLSRGRFGSFPLLGGLGQPIAALARQLALRKPFFLASVLGSFCHSQNPRLTYRTRWPSSRPPSLRHPCLGRYACGIRRSQERRGAGEDQLFPHSQRSAPVETYRACNTNIVWQNPTNCLSAPVCERKFRPRCAPTLPRVA